MTSFIRFIFNKKRIDINAILIIFFVFFLTLATRVYKLNQTPIYPDEITWMVRSKETALAIRTLNLDYFKDAWWTVKDNTQAISIPLAVSAGFPIIYLAKGQSVLSYNLFQDYIVGRDVVILFTALFMAVYYIFVRKYFGKRLALFSSFLLILDPIFVANSKIMQNDIFLTGFIFFALASYLLVKNKTVSIALSSVGLTAAFLTKPNGILVIPVFFLQIFLNRKYWKDELFKFVITLLISYVLIFIFWPAMWHNWLFAIPEYLLRQTRLVSGGINNYFLGELTDNPPFYYYLFLLLVRIPILIVLGFLVYWIKFIYERGKDKLKSNFTVSIAMFFILFVAVISFSPKKLDVRYALPVWPYIYLFASFMLIQLLGNFKKIYEALTVGGIFVYSAVMFISFFPYHDLYYNVLIGGAKNAYKYNLVGICTGSKAAVDYISKCYPDARDLAALGCGRTTIAYYYPYPINYDWKNEDFLIIENYFLQLEKDKEVVSFYNSNEPTYVAKFNGVTLAQIYVRGNHKKVCGKEPE